MSVERLSKNLVMWLLMEISFIGTTVFGHVDRGFRILLDSAQLDQTLWAMPMLLCGDNHQKTPLGGTPWYQYLVTSKLHRKGLMIHAYTVHRVLSSGG
jgi:hypothetical protein